jgi:hypothetical protein
MPTAIHDILRTFPNLFNSSNSFHCTPTHTLCDENHLESSKLRGCGMDPFGSGQGAVMGFGENGNVSSCCTKGGEILGLQNYYQRLKQNCPVTLSEGDVIVWL